MVPKGLRMDGGSTRSIQPQDTARVPTPPVCICLLVVEAQNPPGRGSTAVGWECHLMAVPSVGFRVNAPE